MSKTTIPEKTKNLLWAQAAGRCQYKNCNEVLYQDLLTKRKMNKSYVAHIIADEPTGPRGCTIQSPLLKKDLSNLMLLCDTHHRLVDIEAVEEHPVHMLKEMKFEHEMRISKQTSVTEEGRSHLLLFGANIGDHNPLINRRDAGAAISPSKYPENTVEIGLKNSAAKDSDPDFWKIEINNLRKHFQSKVLNLVEQSPVKHLSVFALGPIPLLIELGILIGDIQPADVYQRRREPSTWIWDGKQREINFKVTKPQQMHKKVALNLSLSGSISNDRIVKVLGQDTDIWTLTIDEPNNDFLHSKEQLVKFRKRMRRLLDEIKLQHGQDTELHLFPAIPVSVAVEIGRIRMPKADMKIHIYDQNNALGGFILAHTIENLTSNQDFYV
jgi:hypothetical protein